MRIVAATRDSSLALQAVLDGSSINRTTFDRLSAHARLVNGRLEAQVLGSSPTDLVDARLEGALPDRTRPAEPMRLSARGRVRIADLGGLLGRDSLEAGSDLCSTSRASQARNSGAAGLSGSGRIEGGGRFGHARIDSVRGAFTLAHGLLDVPRLEVRGRGMEVTGAGRVALPFAAPGDSTSFKLTGAFRDFGPFAPLLGARSMAGSGRFAVQASGVRAATEVSGELHGAGVARDEIRADSLAPRSREPFVTRRSRRWTRASRSSLVRAGLPPRDDGRARPLGRAGARGGGPRGRRRSRWRGARVRADAGSRRTRLRVDRIELARAGRRGSS